MDLTLGDYLQLARTFFLSVIPFLHEFGELHLQVDKSAGKSTSFWIALDIPFFGCFFHFVMDLTKGMYL